MLPGTSQPKHPCIKHTVLTYLHVLFIRYILNTNYYYLNLCLITMIPCLLLYIKIFQNMKIFQNETFVYYFLDKSLFICLLFLAFFSFYSFFSHTVHRNCSILFLHSTPPSPAPPPVFSRSTPPLFAFSKEQASQLYQPNMA